MGETNMFRAKRESTRGGIYDDLCERIGARLTKDMTVLELGCGSARMTLPLCGNVSLWEATDPSKAIIEKDRKIPHSDRLRFSVMDPASLSFEHSSFDVVVAVNTLLTASRPDPALREIRRVLRPGGILFVPAYMLGGTVKKRSRRAFLRGSGVFHEWTAAEYLDLIARYGFSVEKAVLLPDRLSPVCYLEAKNIK